MLYLSSMPETNRRNVAVACIIARRLALHATDVIAGFDAFGHGRGVAGAFFMYVFDPDSV